MSIDVNVQNDLVIVTESSEDITVNVSNAQGPAGANGVGVPVGGSTNQVLKKLSGTNYDTYWAADGQGVPYSGATGDVNLGEFALSAGQLTLDTSPTGTAVVGTTRWNDTIGSSETTLKGGSVILKNGVDLVARVVNKVFPNATLTKAAYQAVRVSGAQGQRLAVAYAQANNDANSADTIGLVCETIATNQEGFIITVGQLEGINTTGSLQGETWVDGDVLYLSPTTPGAITKVKPTGNGHIVVIGYVEYAHVNNGKIYVKVMNGWELDELHDVSIVSPANNEALIYESATSLWKNKTIASALGYTPISGTGASGQVAYWNGTNSQTGSNNLFWDAANARLGIGTTTPTNLLDIVKNQNAETTINISNTTLGSVSSAKLSLNSDFGSGTIFKLNSSYTAYKIFSPSNFGIYNFSAGDIAILNDVPTGKIKFAAGGSSTAQATITAAGRLLLGTTTESTFLLDVNGTARVSGAAYLATSSGSVGIGTTSPSYKLDVQGTIGTVAIRAASNTAGDILYYATGSVTGSTDAFRTAINATGNVAAFLANSNSATGSSVLDISVPSASTGDPYISFTTSGATNWSIGIDNSDGDKLKIGPVDNPSNSSNAIVAHTTGNISLNTSTNYASAQLAIDSTTKGFLPPRMTNAQRTAISTPAVGLIVYCTDATEGLYVYKSTGWTFVI